MVIFRFYNGNCFSIKWDKNHILIKNLKVTQTQIQLTEIYKCLVKEKKKKDDVNYIMSLAN